MNETMNQEPKQLSLKLKPFDWVSTNQSAVNIHEFNTMDVSGKTPKKLYSATILLWLHKSGKEKVVPITLETEIFGEYAIEVAYEAANIALRIAGNVYSDVLWFDVQGNEVDTLKVSDIFEHFGDESLMDSENAGCTGCGECTKDCVSE
jgi:hypothetical protein